ncbi:MAG: hypothetical protein DMG97_41365, partial [Acidobacteria bacterium]
QAEQTPYTVESGGGISTNCQINGSTNSSFSAHTLGNYSDGFGSSTTYGSGSSTENLRMNCNSHDNTLRWNHVLVAMLAEASDGNAYVITCDRAWRWSKCTSLKPGDTFLAHHSNKGIVVQFANQKGEAKEGTYSVVTAKALN